jgi:hypothetical protein
VATMRALVFGRIAGVNAMRKRDKR